MSNIKSSSSMELQSCTLLLFAILLANSASSSARHSTKHEFGETTSNRNNNNGQKHHRHHRAVYLAALDGSRLVNSSESLSSGYFYQQDQPAILDQCCACDEAKYELVFEGLWSKYTHPDDFPENYWQAYFSDIIGASHSNDFRMWSQDSIASEGVKELAESGATKKLESELKQVSSKTRTIIKARELRYPTLNSKTSAVFRTDKHHHLVSILSKLGPSPDWMVGVSGLELCQIDCTWAIQRVVNLYLWDAGTDSGTNFASSDLPTRPQERVHPYKRSSSASTGSLQTNSMNKQQQQLQDTYNDPLSAFDAQSQFYQASSLAQEQQQQQQQPLIQINSNQTPLSNNNQLSGEQMKPFARLTVTRQRIYEKSCNGDAIAHQRPSIAQIAHRQHNLSILQQQQHHNQQTMSAIDVNGEQLPALMKQPTSYSDCRFTDWSDWSSCSSTCGKGIRTRTRSFLDEHAHLAGCVQSDLIEKEVCLSECLSNSTTCVTRDWSDWSKCSVNCGVGYRKRTRSLIGPQRHACNSIELAEMEQCNGACDSDEQPGLHCAVSDWSQWSECSVACGKGTKIRTRQFVRKEDAENCNVKLIQKQSCSGRPELCKQVSKDACMKSPDFGWCKAQLPRWYYDTISSTCKRFTFGGCGGNNNNFRTYHECYRSCVANSTGDNFNFSIEDNDRNFTCRPHCMLQPESGICYAAFRRFYYDKISAVCKQFTYGGCSGNANNFATLQDCQIECANTCGLCLLPLDRSCQRMHPLQSKWYFDKETGVCVESQCQMNLNAFKSKEECLNKCDAWNFISRHNQTLPPAVVESV